MKPASSSEQRVTQATTREDATESEWTRANTAPFTKLPAEKTGRSRYYDARMVEAHPLPTVPQLIAAMERFITKRHDLEMERINRRYSGGCSPHSETK